MENSKNDTVEKVSFWRQHYPLVVVILTFIIITLYSIAVFYLSFRDMFYVVHPLVGLGSLLNILMLIISPIISLTVICLIIGRTVSSQRNIQKMLIDFIAFGLAIALVFVTYTFLLSFSVLGDKHTARDRLQVDNGAVYTLIGRHSYPVESEILTIYKCDNIGLFCSRVFETGRQYRSYYPIELAYNEENQQFSIIVNDEVVETIQLE
ncbi:MAG: hypothetical protein Phog2KO_07200 [Phototrophicaceae bacterium]